MNRPTKPVGQINLIFISHSSADNQKAQALCEWLEKEGWAKHQIYLDIHDLHAGSRWREALDDRISNQCEAFIVCLSDEWLKSPECIREFTLAEKAGHRIFPVIVAQMSVPLPRYITDLQFADISGLPDDQDGLRKLKSGLSAARVGPAYFAWPPRDEPNRAVYRGLKAYEEVDAAVFFGRDASIRSALDEVRKLCQSGSNRGLVILAASGAGKSSFLRSGLLPRLKRDSRFFVLPAVTPNGAPLTGLNGLWASLGVEDQSGSAQEVKWAALTDALDKHRAAKKIDDVPPSIILPIDQAEEFYRSPTGEASELLALLALVFSTRRDVIVIFAMRADSWEYVQRDARFSGLPFTLFSLPPISPTRLHEVIEGPAKLAQPKVEIDGALTERLLKELGSPDALPWLSFALEYLLLRKGVAPKLTLDDYESRIGDLGKAIDAIAEQALHDASSKEVLEEFPWLLRSLVRIQSSNNTVSLTLASMSRPSPATNSKASHRVELIQLLIDCRILIESAAEAARPTIRFAHEAVLRGWRKAATTIDEYADFYRQRELAEAEFSRWVIEEKNPEALLPMSRLERLEKLVDEYGDEVDPPIQDYIRLSRKAATTRNRKVLFAKSMFGVFGIILAFGIAAYGLARAQGEVEHEIADIYAFLATGEIESAGNRFDSLTGKFWASFFLKSPAAQRMGTAMLDAPSITTLRSAATFKSVLSVIEAPIGWVALVNYEFDNTTGHKARVLIRRHGSQCCEELDLDQVGHDPTLVKDGNLLFLISSRKAQDLNVTVGLEDLQVWRINWSDSKKIQALSREDIRTLEKDGKLRTGSARLTPWRGYMGWEWKTDDFHSHGGNIDSDMPYVSEDVKSAIASRLDPSHLGLSATVRCSEARDVCLVFHSPIEDPRRMAFRTDLWAGVPIALVQEGLLEETPNERSAFAVNHDGTQIAISKGNSLKLWSRSGTALTLQRSVKLRVAPTYILFERDSESLVLLADGTVSYLAMSTRITKDTSATSVTDDPSHSRAPPPPGPNSAPDYSDQFGGMGPFALTIGADSNWKATEVLRGQGSPAELYGYGLPSSPLFRRIEQVQFSYAARGVRGIVGTLEDPSCPPNADLETGSDKATLGFFINVDGKFKLQFLLRCVPGFLSPQGSSKERFLKVLSSERSNSALISSYYSSRIIIWNLNNASLTLFARDDVSAEAAPVINAKSWPEEPKIIDYLTVFGTSGTPISFNVGTMSGDKAVVFRLVGSSLGTDYRPTFLDLAHMTIREIETTSHAGLDQVAHVQLSPNGRLVLTEMSGGAIQLFWTDTGIEVELPCGDSHAIMSSSEIRLGKCKGVSRRLIFPDAVDEAIPYLKAARNRSR